MNAYSFTATFKESIFFNGTKLNFSFLLI